jgi:hypothetical protein
MIMYSAIVFYLYVREQSRVTQVTLTARTDVVAVVGFVSASTPAAGRLVGVLQTSGKHD